MAGQLEEKVENAEMTRCCAPRMLRVEECACLASRSRRCAPRMRSAEGSRPVLGLFPYARGPPGPKRDLNI